MRSSRPGCLRWIIVIVVLGGMYFCFRYELVFLRDFALMLIQGHPVEGFPDLADAFRITLLIALNILAVLFFGLLVLYWVASTAFPVRNNRQVYTLIRRILRSTLGQAPPLLVVRDGVMVGEVGRTAGGTILVDLESAVVIESQRFRAGTRVEGPGLVFLSRGERLRDIVHLRKQFRIQLNVLGQTSDGIEMRTHTFAIFTLDQLPDVIQTAYVGEQEPENLRLLQIDAKTRQIKSIRDELDEQDRQEIHAFAQEFLYFIEPNSPLELHERPPEYPPYPIDSERITAGVYSRARNVSDSKSASRWTDLPVMVAAETYRNLIARYSLDQLYLPDDPVNFPLQSEVKPEFARRIRHMGVMSYQFLARNDGEPPAIGQRVDHRYFRISPVQKFSGSKLLRDHGIKVIHAGFSELVPTDAEVNHQRLKNWRARWQQRANQILAEKGQELIRIQNEARASARREWLGRFKRLFENHAYSEEKLAALVIEELEALAADPVTQMRVSRDTLNQLRSLRVWLLPEEGGTSQPAEDHSREAEG